MKDFVLVFKFFHLTSCGILRYGRVFKHTIFFKPIFLKPPTFHGRLDGRSCSCILYCENHFNLEHDGRLGNMRYTLDLIVISIGIIGFFQLVSKLIIFVYTHILFSYICMYQCQLVYSFHTYIRFSCA